MEAIRKELGESDDSQREITELTREDREGGDAAEDVRKEADRELARLARIPPQAAEYTVARTLPRVAVRHAVGGGHRGQLST